MANVDPNLYALSIQLDLDTGEAFDALDAFDDEILKIEHKVADAAQKAIGEIEDSGTRAVKSLDNMLSVLDSLVVAGNDVQSSFDNAGLDSAEQSLMRIATLGEEVGDSFSGLDSAEQSLMRIINLSEEINQAFADAAAEADFADQLNDQLKIGSKIYDQQDELQLLSEELQEVMEEEQKIAIELFKLWQELPKILRDKNKLHQQELGLVQEESFWAKILGKNFAEVLDTTKNAAALITGAVYLMQRWANWFAKLDEHAENFYVTNFRLYGTQQAMVQQARLMSTESGVFLDRMLEAMKVLGDLRIPREEMETYAKAIGRAERVTGVGVDTLGRYAWSLRSIGWEADRTVEHLRVLQEEQRKLGLSAHDMTRMLDDTAMSTLELQQILGGDLEVENFRRLQMQLTHLGKEMGLSADMGLELQKMLSDPKALAILTNYMNEGETGAEAFRLAMLRVGNDYGREMDRIIALQKAGAQNSMEYRVTLDRLSETLGMSKEMVLFQTQLRQIAEQQGLNLEKTEDWEKALKQLQKGSMDPFDEATQGLYRSLGELYNAISNLIGYALQPLADALAVVVEYLTWFIQKITLVVKWLNETYNWLAETIPGFKLFVGMIGLGITVLGVFILALGFLAVTLGFIPNLMRLITRAIIGFFRGLGQGLAAFARAVAAHTVTLLQLALAFALIGAGAWMLARAFQIVTERGWEGIGMFAVFLVIGALFIGLLILLAYAAMPVIPALLAIGAAAALIGLGFMLAGVGVWLMAQSLYLIATYGLQAAVGIIALAGALGVLALVGFFAFAGLMAVGAALWFIAIPVFLLGLGFQMLAAAIGLLTFEAVTTAAWALLVGATIMLAAAIILFPAAVLLVVASAFLLIAAVSLTVASIGLLVASVLFIVASTILAIGAALFFGSALAIFGGAFLIFMSGIMVLIGAASLIVGLGLLIVASGMMAAVAAALWLGSWALAAGAAAIAPAAAAIFIAGLAILAGGTMFYVGALLLYYGATMFSKTGELLQVGALSILGAAENLITATNMMILFGWLTVTAAAAMAFGAITLVGASVMLLVAGLFLVGVSWVLGVAGAALVVTGFLLYLGSLWIGMAIANMARQSEDFYKFAEAMSQIADGINALMALKPRSIIDVANALSIAAPKLKKAVKELDGIGADFNKAFAGFDPNQTEILKLAPILNQLSASLDAVDISTEPLDKIRASLDLINEAIIQLDDNADKLVKNLSDFGPVLEQQAEQIEAAAQRIQEAIENRGIPAMRAAQDAGLAQVQQGDVIATVQVMPNQEGQERSREEELSEARNAQLARLVELLEGITGQEDLKNINELLAAVLPGLGAADSSELHNAMNQWTG